MLKMSKRKDEYEALREKMNFFTPERMSKEKADKIFALAWEYGHANGEQEVENYYKEIIEVARN